jgi:hypothetical protein
LLLLLVCAALPLKAQQDVKSSMAALKDAFVLLETAPSNEERKATQLKLESSFQELLSKTGAWETNFDSLRSISCLLAPDKRFRIISWVMTSVDRNTFLFGGLIQEKPDSKGNCKVWLLKDISPQLEKPDTAKLKAGAWYGVYYNTLLLNKKGPKRIYTLIGWKGATRFTTKKVIDLLSFEKAGPCFSSPLLPVIDRKDKKGKKTCNRLVFEFNAEVVMSLRFDKTANRIVFDHLAPSEPAMEGIFAAYGPDLSYDGLAWKKGRWNYLPDIEAKNSDSKGIGSKRRKKDKALYKPK